MPDISKLSDLSEEWRAKIDAATAEAVSAHALLREIDNEAEEIDDKISRLIGLEKQDHAERVLNRDDNHPPVKPKRRTAIANLQERREAIRIARPIQVQHCQEAQAAEEKVRAEFADAVVPVLADLRLTALLECRGPLNELVRRLAFAAGFDEIERRVVGRDFSVSGDVNRAGLFKGTTVLARLKGGLTHHLQELLEPDLRNVDAFAASVAGDLVRQLPLT